MNGRAFLDTNILVYFYSEDDENKRNRARLFQRHSVTQISL